MAEYADQRVSSIDPRSELCGGGRNGGGGWEGECRGVVGVVGGGGGGECRERGGCPRG